MILSYSASIQEKNFASKFFPESAWILIFLGDFPEARTK
jgi:hypothetical protein